MFKKIFLVISFVAIFFYQAPLITPKILAASENSSTESIFEKIWQGIISALFPKLVTYKIDGTKKSLISSQDSRQDFTDYTKNDKDWSHRTLTESLRKKLIGMWFNEVISKPGLFVEKAYSDEVVSEAKGDCPEIKISDIVFYYATQTDQKILYARGNSSPIDYPPTIDHDNTIGPSICYENAYRGIQSVPQGLFQGKGEASLSSTQGNDQIRYTLPNSLQDKSAPDNNTAENTELLIEDTEKHLKRTRVVYMPQNIKDQTDCSSNLTDEEKMDNLYKNFQKSLKPQKWIGKIKKDTTDTEISQDYQKGISVSDCSLGAGLSQYGAEGMAMKGKTYTEILTAYYGIGNDYGSGTMQLGTVNSATDKITVKLERKENMSDNNGNSDCDELVNEYPDRFEISGKTNTLTISNQLKQLANNSGIYRTLTLTVEDYVMGLGEIGLNWKLAAHQALTVAARSYAYGASNNLNNSITDTSEHDQVFQCGRLLKNLQEDTVQTKAVKLTTGVVITRNGEVFTAHYLRCFGGASTSDSKFDGSDYEEIAGLKSNQTKGTCDDFVTLPETKNIRSTTTSTINDLYIFPSSVHGGRIKEDYDLGTGNESQYLQTYSGNCRLDSRIFPALNRLVADAQAAGLKIGFYSCYRTYAEQAALSEDNPNTTTTSLPGKSAHHTGRAIDFANPTSKISDSSDLYKWLATNASKYGFYPYNVEAHHWEYNP